MTSEELYHNLGMNRTVHIDADESLPYWNLMVLYLDYLNLRICHLFDQGLLDCNL